MTSARSPSAGLLLPATLAERLGLEQAADELIDLGNRPGAAHPGRKLLTLVHSLVAGGDCIDDVEVLRAGATASVLGHRVLAASTVGTFLRLFTFGHVRQLDRLAEVALTRAWVAGAGPGDGPMTIDADSTICEVYGHDKQGATYGYTRQLGYHPLLATRAETGEILHARQRTGKANTARGMPRFVDETDRPGSPRGRHRRLTFRADSGFWSAKTIARLRAHDTRFSITVRQTKPVRARSPASPRLPGSTSATPDSGIAQVAEAPFRGDRLIVRRVRNLDDQQQLFPTWRYHAFVTDRVATAVELDADHRRHAVVELAIRDAKHGSGLRPPPVGPVLRQRRLAGAGHPRPQPAALDRHPRPRHPRRARRRQDPAPHPARPAWPAHPLRPPLAAAPARPLAMGTLVHDGACPAALHPRPRRLTAHQPEPSRPGRSARRQPARTPAVARHASHLAGFRASTDARSVATTT